MPVQLENAEYAALLGERDALNVSLAEMTKLLTDITQHAIGVQVTGFLGVPVADIHAAEKVLARYPGHSFSVDGHIYTLEDMLSANRDSPEVCAWVLAAAPGDTYQGMLSCRCVA